MALRDLVIRLEMDDNNFKGKIEGSTAAIRRFQRAAEQSDKGLKKAEGATRSWGKTLRDSIIVLGLSRHALLNLDAVLLSIPRSIIQANAQMEKMQALMRGLSRETSDYAAIQAEAAKGMEFVFDASKSSPFDVQTVTDAFVKFRSAGIDPTNGSLQALIDSVAKFGGTSEQMHRSAVAIQQMAGKGVISMEELRQQLGEAVPDAMMIMARATDMSLGRLTKLISLGVVESTGALQAMFRQMAIENAGSAAEMAQTWDGLINRMKTQWVELSKVAGDTGFFDEAKDELRSLVDGFMNSAEAMKGMKVVGQILRDLVVNIGEATRFIYEWGDVLTKVGTGILLTQFIPALKDMGKWTGLVGGSVGGLAETFKSFQKQSQIAAEKAQFLNNRMKALEYGRKSFAQYTVAATAQTRALSGAMVTLGNAAKTAAVGIKAVGLSLFRMVGSVLAIIPQIAIMTAAVYAATKAWDHFSGAHAKAMQELRDAPVASLTSDDFESLGKDLVKKKKELRALEAKLVSENFSGGGTDETFEGIKKAKEAIAKIESQIEQYKDYSARKSVEKKLSNENFAIERELRPTVNKYVQDLEQIRRAIDETNLKASEKTKEMTKARSGLTDWIKQIVRAPYDEKIKALQDADVFAVKSGKQRSALEVELIHKEIKEWERLRDEKLKAYDMPQGGVNTGSAAEEKGLKSLEKYMESIAKKSTKTKAKLEEVNEYWQEFVRRAQAGQFGQAIKQELEEMTPKIKEYKKTIDEFWKNNNDLKQRAKDVKAYEKNLQSVETIMASMDRKFGKRENQNPFLKNSVDADIYRDKLNKLIAKFEELKLKGVAGAREELEKMPGYFAAIEKAANQADAASFKELTRNINDELLPATQQIGVETKKQIAYLKEWRDEAKNLSPDQLNAYVGAIGALNAKLARESEKPIQKLAREWKENTEYMDQIWEDTMSGFVDTLTEGLLEGEMKFDTFLKSVASMIIKAQLQSAIGGLISGLSGGLSGGTPVGTHANTGLNTGAQSPTFGFALGGIMTSEGALALKKYANGGIANRPQVALFGEGSQPEAYVPLPDGRTIPVTVNEEKGSKDKSKSKGGDVQVNVVNTTGVQLDAEKSTPRFDGEKMVLDVVLKAMARPGNFRDTMRGAVR